MKYLKKFNESSSGFTNITSECKDILVELSDKNIKYNVYGFESAKILGTETYKDLIRVEVGDQYNNIKMVGMDLMFEHLFSYMESEGFELGKDSYYENSNWEYHEACPECDSQSITPPNDLQSMEGWKCNKCKHEGHQDDFQRPEHPITKKDLFWSIRENYHIQFMSLAFYRAKHLKTYKMFEMWVDDPKFYRFSRVELPIGELEPVKRKMWGPEQFNQSLVKLGFPDKNKCIHFMDSLAFSPEYKGLYGDYIYQIQVDDNSNLGWCYVFPVNDWFYKGNPFQYALRKDNKLVKSIIETPYNDLSSSNGDEDEMAKYLLQFGIIGCGTIDDLKRSPHYGKEKLFVWTNDKVITSNYQAPIKEPKIGTYKTERLLTTDDFTSRGISTKEIGSFYQSELGKSVKGKTKEEALELLEQWIKNQLIRNF